jgi:hypothetical protein
VTLHLKYVQELTVGLSLTGHWNSRIQLVTGISFTHNTGAVFTCGPFHRHSALCSSSIRDATWSQLSLRFAISAQKAGISNPSCSASSSSMYP